MPCIWVCKPYPSKDSRIGLPLLWPGHALAQTKAAEFRCQSVKLRLKSFTICKFDRCIFNSQHAQLSQIVQNNLVHAPDCDNYAYGFQL